MFFPLHDGVTLKFLRRAWITQALIAANIIVFIAERAGLLGDTARLDLALGLIPAVLFDHAALARGLAIIPAPLTLLTGMFLHGGFTHLAGNMAFLWVFGDNVEDAMGPARFLLFYTLSGVAGSLLYAFMDPLSEAPLIGASGAIAGVIAAYLLLYPGAKIFGLALQFIPLRVSAFWCLGLWFLFQIYSALTIHATEVGYWAHVGGFLAGAALTPWLKRREAPILRSRAPKVFPVN